MFATAYKYANRTLPPRVYRFLKFYRWCARFYLPRRIAAFFIRRTPRVRVFTAGNPNPQFVEQLLRTNVFAPTAMCRVMTRHGSDKGDGWHNYTTVYSSLFSNLRGRPLSIFELGLGTNNPNFAFGMGPAGRPGASLRGWRELFPKALIFGADIDHSILLKEDRINTYYCDQLDEVAIRNLWAHALLREGMDIIIDDGLHTFDGNTSFLERSLEQLRSGGFYIVEDISRHMIVKWTHQIDTIYLTRFPNYEFALVELPNSSNCCDNNLLIIHRVR
ncbi:MAG: hypothetical protein PGMFKBFP_03035 [Anaerolineales bacterium]|nr:hypothetical protein [Anaerolineales bacterium]